MCDGRGADRDTRRDDDEQALEEIRRLFAHPDFRDDLEREARGHGLIPRGVF